MLCFFIKVHVGDSKQVDILCLRVINKTLYNIIYVSIYLMLNYTFIVLFKIHVCTFYISVNRTKCKSLIYFSFIPVSKPAPDWNGTAVVNGKFEDLKLRDFRGKYLVMLFYPLDL